VPTITYPVFSGFRWMKITPPWTKGYRPAATYRQLEAVA
jgi:hypothetical protein